MKLRKMIASLALAGALAFCMTPAVSLAATNAAAATSTVTVVDTQSDVTSEMCMASYWYKLAKNPDKVLMSVKQIRKQNAANYAAAGDGMSDLTTAAEVFDADAKRAALVSALESDTNYFKSRGAKYLDGQEIDFDQLVSDLKVAIETTGYSGVECATGFGIVTSHANLKSLPLIGSLGYSATDSDDEAQNSSLSVGTPFIVRGKCTTDQGDFYWGCDNNCTGWIEASKVALVKVGEDEDTVETSKERWLNMWVVDPADKDVLVVTGDKVYTEPSKAAPATSRVMLALGARLKLVPQDEKPAKIAGRGTWNNYVVYLPTRTEEGLCELVMTLIPQHSCVSVGFLPMTQKNILKVAFRCLGNSYGWGGEMESMDCTQYTRSIYRCFGLEIPRNTTWQVLQPNRVTSMTTDGKVWTNSKKRKYLKTIPAGSILVFPGHATVYLGTVNGKPYVISDLGSVSETSAVTQEVVVKSYYSVAINSLNVRRGSGITWLTALDTAITYGTTK